MSLEADVAARRAGLSVLFFGLTMALGVRAVSAASSLHIGAGRPTLVLPDSWDRLLDLSNLGNQPVLLLYEDQKSSHQNDPLKQELAVLARGGGYRGRISLVPVADVADFDFWPARGLVKSAIQKESSKLQADIYCDWDGRIRSAIGARRGVSTVALYNSDGVVVFAYEGAMPKATRDELIDLLRKALAT